MFIIIDVCTNSVYQLVYGDILFKYVNAQEWIVYLTLLVADRCTPYSCREVSYSQCSSPRPKARPFHSSEHTI